MENVTENAIFSSQKDPILELLNQNSNPLKNEDFIKGSLDGFDKFFNEEENIRESKNPVNSSFDYSPISKQNIFNKSYEKIINGGKNKIFSFYLKAKEINHEKRYEKNQTKKQLFNTLQNDKLEDLKKKKLILNRESAKRSRLKKKNYIENLEKEYLILKEEIMRLKSSQNILCKNTKEILNDSIPSNNIIENIKINNIINNPKDKEIMRLKKDELNIISNNLGKDSKTINNYINKQKKLLHNCLIRQIDIMVPLEIKYFQNKFLKMDEIKKDDSISIIKNKITRNLEVIKDLYDIEIIPETDKNNSLKNDSKGNNIFNFYKYLKSYVEQYELIYNKIDNLSE